MLLVDGNATTYQPPSALGPGSKNKDLGERICQLCHLGVESGEYHVCHSAFSVNCEADMSLFYEMRGNIASASHILLSLLIVRLK